MSHAETVLLLLFVIVMSAAAGAGLHAMVIAARAESARWRRDDAEHAPVLERVRRWQAATAGVSAQRIAGHRATAFGGARRMVSRAVRLLARMKPTAAVEAPSIPARPSVADVNVQGPPPPYNPPYRGRASTGVPFDVQMWVENDVLHGNYRAAANDQDTGLTPRVVLPEMDGAR